ncbi:MAG: hypothetical protein CPDRYMAC_5315 [uncultured Paraburkholderia sp.]|nr:MAG: hypothetical protein CPDRYDRY_5224 [uncultured Paraburkholderia sp.]CAH2940473.1 MAG: hypothetical protein CPDRYMAC_5315 [uncultured Paraburkholderia sp.]
MQHYADNLFNPHWGEQLGFHDDEVHVAMVSQGLDEEQAKAAWAPFIDWIRASPANFTFSQEPRIGAAHARR